MNNSRKYIILIACLLAIGLSSVAQQVRPVYPVKPLTQEDISRRQRIPEWGTNTRSASSAVLPEGVDNSTLKYFPPVFSQLGNSCSQASGVRYVYTYELNRLLDRAADSPEHIFNYHFTWNYLNEGNDQGSHPELGYNMMKVAGAVTLSDMNDESAATSSTTWMTGYDKYLRAMNYRVKSYSKFTLKTREGIDRLRQYLYNRGEEGEPGGVVTFSCKSSDWKEVTYKGTSVTGLTHMITRPGTDGAHALTIAGYDDTVAYDLNGDGEITEDERGAFIVVNSWGTWWGSEGKCYYPYKYFLLPAAEGGLAQAGRAVEQHVVQGLSPLLGGLDEHGQVVLRLLLADILPQGLGAQGTLVLVIPRQRCGDERLLGLKPGIGKVNAQVCSLPHSDVDACNKNEPLPKRIFSPTLILDHPFQRLLDDLLLSHKLLSLVLSLLYDLLSFLVGLSKDIFLISCHILCTLYLTRKVKSYAVDVFTHLLNIDHFFL